MKQPDFQFNKLRILFDFDHMGSRTSKIFQLLDFIESRGRNNTVRTPEVVKHFGWSHALIHTLVKSANLMLTKHKIIRPHGRLTLIKRED